LNSAEVTVIITVNPVTSVILLSFTTQASADSVALAWKTASELDNAGFNLWRSTTIDGEYTKINDTLIPAKGSVDMGASYEYVDSDIIKEVTYDYKLEDVDIHGVSTFHGPVVAMPGANSIYLPVIWK
jgi:hypothetical protein